MRFLTTGVPFLVCKDKLEPHVKGGSLFGGFFLVIRSIILRIGSFLNMGDFLNDSMASFSSHDAKAAAKALLAVLPKVPVLAPRRLISISEMP